MELTAKIDEYGKPAWIVLMVLGFIVFWPIGLGILGYLIWSGRMGCCRKGGPGRWHNEDKRASAGGFSGWRRDHRTPTSGNRAFDDYREQTLKRLEDEHEEFMGFLKNLRHARDKAEFDQFMAERKAGGATAATPDDDADSSDIAGKDAPNA